MRPKPENNLDGASQWSAEMKIIDLRSDTVTHPTDEMRKAMFEAEVGDDVFGEDPTVNRLEAMAAERMGKEAALFTASGTMSNILSVLTHTRPGNEIILGSEAHIFWYEVGGAAALGGLVMRTVPNDAKGQLSLTDIEKAIRDKTNIHFPETALLCLENTHNRCGGAVLTPEYTSKVTRLAHYHGLKVHLDGARIFNAAVALGVPASDLTKDVDSVCFCLSKGLSAPVGSLLCGSADFVEHARKRRKMLGGGMRQAGVIAAAGIVALNTMIDRLAEDHVNARMLAAGLVNIQGISLAQAKVATNIVMFDLAPALSGEQFLDKLDDKGVKIGNRGGNSFRAVTNRMVTARDIDYTLHQVDAVCRELT
jgi:threonine aldolase